MSRVTCIIVDDESLARSNLRSALHRYENWTILREFCGAENVVDAVLACKPDVVFLDIKMPGKNGLDCARELVKMNMSVKIIFNTAYDEYALQAFELFALDYLLKPFNDERFDVAVRRAEAMLASDRSKVIDQNSRLAQSGEYLTKLIVSSASSLRIIDIANIYWFKACGNYVEVMHDEGIHLHRISLSFLEGHLDPKIFMRVHRSSIVRISEIREIASVGGDKYQLILSSKDKVKITNKYRGELLSRIGFEDSLV